MPTPEEVRRATARANRDDSVNSDSLATDNSNPDAAAVDRANRDADARAEAAAEDATNAGRIARVNASEDYADPAYNRGVVDPSLYPADATRRADARRTVGAFDVDRDNDGFVDAVDDQTPAIAAAWNDDTRHPVASFLNRADAEAYAERYGGVVEAIGVAFAVGPDADHDGARDDYDKATGVR